MEEFAESVYGILSSLKTGQLMTYGQVAKQAGFPHHARHVGKVLSTLPKGTRLPWHRIVNAQGKLSLKGESFLRQKALLEKEGIEVNDEGTIINFKRIWLN